MKAVRMGIFGMVVALGAAGCDGGNEAAMDTQPAMDTQSGMAGMEPVDAPFPPAVSGYAEGEEIAFLHTETSDSAVAQVLTDMMGSPVLVVAALARVPDEALADVFVFENGIQPEGPRGPFEYQPDVFDCTPEAECYTPLRAVNLVNWINPDEARVLDSAEQVREAAEQGLIRIERPGVVVNMPLVRWPGGER